MASSTVLTDDSGQVVRLPEEVNFPDDVKEVDVLKIGNGRLIVPRGKRWDDFFAEGPRVSEDFSVD